MKTALITGGSRGIGAATARRFAKEGFRVIINYNNSEAQAKALAAETGGIAIRADVGSPEQVAAMAEKITAEHGALDVIVNNAGIAHFGLLTDMSEAEWQNLVNINLGGAFRVTKGLIRPMIAAGRGCVINISSMWGQVGASCEAAYSASKAGLIGLTKALAKELGPSGIRVNCIAPGVIDTDMNASLDDETLEELKEETPLGVIGSPEDVADAAYFLYENEFVTGQVIGVNGGFVI